MDTNLFYFLLGTAIAIPAGIFVNLITPLVQEWMTNRPRVSATKRRKSLDTELFELTEYHANQEKLILKTVSNLFLVLFYFGIGNAIWAIPAWFIDDLLRGSYERFGIGEIISFPIFNPIAGLAAMFLFLISILICLNHVRLISKIRNFGEYKKKIEEQIKQLESQQ